MLVFTRMLDVLGSDDVGVGGVIRFRFEGVGVAFEG